MFHQRLFRRDELLAVLLHLGVDELEGRVALLDLHLLALIDEGLTKEIGDCECRFRRAILEIDTDQVRANWTYVDAPAQDLVTFLSLDQRVGTLEPTPHFGDLAQNRAAEHEFARRLCPGADIRRHRGTLQQGLDDVLVFENYRRVRCVHLWPEPADTEDEVRDQTAGDDQLLFVNVGERQDFTRDVFASSPG